MDKILCAEGAQLVKRPNPGSEAARGLGWPLGSLQNDLCRISIFTPIGFFPPLVIGGGSERGEEKTQRTLLISVHILLTTPSLVQNVCKMKAGVVKCDRNIIEM